MTGLDREAQLPIIISPMEKAAEVGVLVFQSLEDHQRTKDHRRRHPGPKVEVQTTPKTRGENPDVDWTLAPQSRSGFLRCGGEASPQRNHLASRGLGRTAAARQPPGRSVNQKRANDLTELGHRARPAPRCRPTFAELQRWLTALLDIR